MGSPTNVTLVNGSLTGVAIPEPGSCALVGLVVFLASTLAWLHNRSANRSL